MTVVEKRKATATLAAYTNGVGQGPVVITENGKPVAVLMPLENVDLESVSLSLNPKFIELIERSRARMRAEGSISSEEMRRRFGIPLKKTSRKRSTAGKKT
jgi:PHD/YefM family antitoxin component YafN of YafNO toxin-antitoxin module